MRMGATQSQQITMTGHQFRQFIGPQELRSTRWSSDSPIEPFVDSRGAWQVTTFGYGHGVGLSQVSAYAMAQAGLKAYDILNFFYDHMVIQRLW